ncbi:hypothetical protein JXA27_01365 [Aerococcaceae bacterium zg-B36]|uniref:hypothetical protein n=1 Tax=Aerococcaceae bacterium zg-252 TaxID=2796928 RepID=UPI001BD8A728|nr:hypothetical protein [Aerococcaceae bacterium zg-B36]
MNVRLKEIREEYNLSQKELAELKVKVAQLEKALEEHSDEWNDGDTYYFLDSDGDVLIDYWNAIDVDKNRLSIGNVFKTKEEAEFEAEARKVYHELKKFSRPFVKHKYNWVIEYDLYDNDLSFVDMREFRMSVLYFESEEIAQEAIDAVGEDRVKKYYLRVEE